MGPIFRCWTVNLQVMQVKENGLLLSMTLILICRAQKSRMAFPIGISRNRLKQQSLEGANFIIGKAAKNSKICQVREASQVSA